ncbi:hypothetical protein O181_120673 [Austropuccinia psidii MF-1]|uniref:Uncharacterized protein n=1 Tax=Austropuccinia psidii MF-1 TaxID=1389203 RepID=A0A9Q3KGG0_9BASI|nr:hypothetical protein [Austropuccinia psidii MF-1]
MHTRPHPPPDDTPTLPPISTVTTPYNPYALAGPSIYASEATLTPVMPPRTRHLPSLHSWSAFLTCLQRLLPSLRLYSPRPTCLQRCLPSLCLQCPPDMPLMLLTILMLNSLPSLRSWSASDTTYHPYAHIVLAQHASDTCGVPSQHASDAADHPYACIPPQDETITPPPISALTTPYASTPPPYLLRHFPSLCSRGALKICLRCQPQPPLPLIFSPLLTILMLRY